MFLIGIAGGSGSGKTTFAQKVQNRSTGDVSLLHMDSYYLPRQPESNLLPSGKANFDHPDAFDWELLRQHLLELKSGRDIFSPVYDFKRSTRTTESHLVKANGVLLFEGIFTLFDKQIRDLLDIRVFLQVDADIRFTRRLHRDVKERGRSLESVIEQYYETVRPMYKKFLDPQKEYADFTVGEETDISADILAAKINNLSQMPLVERGDGVDYKSEEMNIHNV